MVTTNVMISTGIVIISIAFGLGAFWMVSGLPGEQKKKQLEELVSQLINFILFIWLSKVILNFLLFINDPLAILAYPSNSLAFYMAFLFSAAFFVYKAKKKHIQAVVFIESFTMVFLTTSILYELIQFVWFDNASSFGCLLLLSVLLILFLLGQGRLKTDILIVGMNAIWSSGMGVLIYLYPLVTVFGYIIYPWFVGLFFVISTFLVFFTFRKEDE